VEDAKSLLQKSVKVPTSGAKKSSVGKQYLCGPCQADRPRCERCWGSGRSCWTCWGEGNVDTGAPLLYNSSVQIDTVPKVKEQCIDVLRVGFPHIARQQIQRDVAKNMVMLIQRENPRTEQIEVASCMTLAAQEDRGKQIVLINFIATHRDHGGRGHAKSLLNAINTYSCFKGKTQVLHVRAQNKAAIGLYRSLGFIEQAGHNKTYPNGDIQLEYRREVAHNEGRPSSRSRPSKDVVSRKL